MRGYFRLREDRDPDAYLLALAVDALPPVVFGLGARGWAPTVELTWYMRAVPVPGAAAGGHRQPGRRRRLVRRGGRGVGRGRAAGRAEPPDRPGRPRRAAYGTLLIFQTNADAAIATTVVPPYSSG